jgi:hypothetical protein
MTALSDPAEILDPEKLAAEDSPARRTMRQEIPGWNFKHGPVNRLPGDGLLLTCSFKAVTIELLHRAERIGNGGRTKNRFLV